MEQEIYKLDASSRCPHTAPLVEDLTKRTNISICFRHLEVNRNLLDPESAATHYPISMFIGEAVNDNKSGAFVPFTIKVNTDPEIATLLLEGTAFVQGTSEEVQKWIKSNRDQAPKIWTRIYQEASAMLTILFKFT